MFGDVYVNVWQQDVAVKESLWFKVIDNVQDKVKKKKSLSDALSSLGHIWNNLLISRPQILKTMLWDRN